MRKTKSSKQNVIAQATILMVAGILVRIIGVLYRSPVTSIIGDEGNGYYSLAYNIYAMVLLISSYSIPMAVSKVVSGKLALKQYREAHKVFSLRPVLCIDRRGDRQCVHLFCRAASRAR